MKNVLFVVTSHAVMGYAGVATGVSLEQFAKPFFALVDAGCVIVAASPRGGRVPVEPESVRGCERSEACRRFTRSGESALENSTRLCEVQPELFDAVYFPGGRGTLWDVARDRAAAKIVSFFCETDRPVIAISHGTAALLRGRRRNGLPVCDGRNVTAPSQEEEEKSGLHAALPFILEERFKSGGGLYCKAEPGRSHVVTDGNLITAQNSASIDELVDTMLDLLQPCELCLCKTLPPVRKVQGTSRPDPKMT